MHEQLSGTTGADLSHSLAATAVHSGAAGYMYATINVVTSKNFSTDRADLTFFGGDTFSVALWNIDTPAAS
jgi:hypothetical protein